MKFTKEQITKAKSAKNAEELLAMAKENGMEMTDDEAKKFFAELNRESKVADDELAGVAGRQILQKNQGVFTVMTDKKELKEEELKKVTGGAQPTQDPKYQKETQVRFYYIRESDLQAIGTIINVHWSETGNRYLYWIDHEDIRFTLGMDVHYFPAGSCEVREENIMYAL